MKPWNINTDDVYDDDDNNNMSINFVALGVHYSRVYHTTGSAIAGIIVHKTRFNGEHVHAFRQKRKQNTTIIIKSLMSVVDTDVSRSCSHALRVCVYAGEVGNSVSGCSYARRPTAFPYKGQTNYGIVR